MEPLEENGEELIDDRGRNVRSSESTRKAGLTAPARPPRTEGDEGWFDGADPDAEPV